MGRSSSWPGSKWAFVVVAVAVVALLAFALVVSEGRGPERAGGTTSTTATTDVVTTATTNVVTTTTVSGVPSDMLNPAVSQGTIMATICVAGYTATVRPAASVTDRLKTHQIVTYGYADRAPAGYEEDHVIALELGGAPSAPANLWPEPLPSSGADDRLENSLHAQVCAGRIDLRSAQVQLLAAKVAHGYRGQASIA